ncbi:unnamed protein product [Heligmosomoides polygyrus]|uniref:Transthyretin-like family protein n=1 Tax=Heligmosomoides polygyrus TaxID=6339 RepID=A0A183FYB2_HELPZ|nr:unnamed protein product [Heligmosomoides polygyrus]
MKSLLLGVALLALLACSMAVLELDGCVRGYVQVGPASENVSLRRELKKELNFSMNSDDTIAEMFVKNNDRKVYAGFAGRRNGGKSITFEFDVSGTKNGPLTAIPFNTFFNYLECEQAYFKPAPAEAVLPK